MIRSVSPLKTAPAKRVTGDGVLAALILGPIARCAVLSSPDTTISNKSTAGDAVTQMHFAADSVLGSTGQRNAQ